MKRRIVFLVLVILGTVFIPVSAQETTSMPPVPLVVRYVFPNVIIEWRVAGCVLFQAPHQPVVWPDVSCDNFGGIISISRDTPDLRFRAVPGMKIALVRENILLSTIILNERVNNPYVGFLPLVLKGNSHD